MYKKRTKVARSSPMPPQWRRQMQVPGMRTVQYGVFAQYSWALGSGMGPVRGARMFVADSVLPTGIGNESQVTSAIRDRIRRHTTQ